MTVEFFWLQIKDLPAFVAVSSNTSGATAKNLFEDVVEELEKQVALIHFLKLSLLFLLNITKF